MGRVEQEMNKNGGILREIQLAINGITTKFISRSNYKGSVFTNYDDDDKNVWREFRRELHKDGFSSSVIHKHKRKIPEYIKELGTRGLLDEQDPIEAMKEWQDIEPNGSTDAGMRSSFSVDERSSIVSGSMPFMTKEDQSAGPEASPYAFEESTSHGKDELYSSRTGVDIASELLNETLGHGGDSCSGDDNHDQRDGNSIKSDRGIISGPEHTKGGPVATGIAEDVWWRIQCPREQLNISLILKAFLGRRNQTTVL